MTARAALLRSSRSLRRLALWALLLGVAAAPARAAHPPETGAAAPDFSLVDLAGRRVSLSALRGRPVILHFWATWCPACRDEMPILEEAARGHPDDLVVLGINLGEKREKVDAYAKENGLTFPILLDGRGAVAARYGVLALPISIVVGADGRVARTVLMGSVSREGLREILAPLLPGR